MRSHGNQCGISTQDRRWKYIAEKVFIPPGAATLNFLVGSTINEGSSNEALGIDNVKLFRIRKKSRSDWSVYSKSIYNPWMYNRGDRLSRFDSVCYHDVDTVVQIDKDSLALSVQSDMKYEQAKQNLLSQFREKELRNLRLDHGWWGFDGLQIVEVDANNYQGMPKHNVTFQMDADHESSLTWDNVTHYISDKLFCNVKKDRIRDKRELLRRTQEVFRRADDEAQLKAIELANDLWLV